MRVQLADKSSTLSGELSAVYDSCSSCSCHGLERSRGVKTLSFAQAVLLQRLSGFGLGRSQKAPQENEESKRTQGIRVSIRKDAANRRIRSWGNHGAIFFAYSILKAIMYGHAVRFAWKIFQHITPIS